MKFHRNAFFSSLDNVSYRKIVTNWLRILFTNLIICYVLTFQVALKPLYVANPKKILTRFDALLEEFEDMAKDQRSMVYMMFEEVVKDQPQVKEDIKLVECIVSWISNFRLALTFEGGSSSQTEIDCFLRFLKNFESTKEEKTWFLS